MTRTLTRRQFLKTGGAAVVTATIGPTAASASHTEDIPEHVTIEFDETTLQRYKPRLVTRHLDFKPTALYGWTVRSPEYDTDVMVYWAEYVAQDGVLPSSPWLPDDNHRGDHEPVLVEVDSETGDVRQVHASVYHWIKGTWLPGTVALYNDTQPQLKPVNPWHQYTTTADPGRDVDLRNLEDVYAAWLNNGLESALVEGANTRPWMMRTRGHWWQDTAAGYSVDAALARNAARVSELPGMNIGGYEASEYDA